MKRKTLFNKSLLWITAGCCLTITACTKRFESINTDPYGLSEKDLAGDFGQFNQIQLNIHQYAPDWEYQRGKGLSSDMWSGYMMTQAPFNGNINNITYAMVDVWNNTGWERPYSNVMAPAKSVLDRAKRDNRPNFEAWGLILRVFTMHRITDFMGPIVYTNFAKFNPDGSFTYDSQQEAYNTFFKELDEAQEKLKPFVENPNAEQEFKRFDLAYNGSYAKWMKLLNSLRLRLATRIIKADPDKAKTEGEKALANPFGLIETNAEDFIIDSKTVTNPIDVIANSWGNARMNASMESFLKGYDDPRMEKYFLPATDPAFAGQYKGIRNGIALPDGVYNNFSSLARLGTKMPLLTAAEVWFLKAEAKLNGWAVPGLSSVKEAYEKGIQLSFSQWGVDASELPGYLASTARPAAYVDPKNAANNVPLGDPILSTISPQWDDAASTSEKMERIITQKWIAVYPESAEAWAEQRRTGYPKLFPVKLNNSNGVIPDGQFIRRMTFPQSERESNQAGYLDAVKKLGGPDNIATRVWWDKP